MAEQAEAATRPPWAGEHQTVKEWTDERGVTHQVGVSVYTALTAPYRGQKAFVTPAPAMKLAKQKLKEVAVLKSTGSSEPQLDDVSTKITLTAADGSELLLYNAKYNQINPSKLVDKLFAAEPRFFSDAVRREPPSEEEEEEEEEEEDGDEDDHRFGKIWEVPEGFEHMPKPNELPKGASGTGALTGLHVAQLFRVGSGSASAWRWYIGKVSRFRGARYTYNYEVTWDEGQTWVNLNLEHYKDAPGDDEQECAFVEGQPPQKNWAFLTKEGTAAANAQGAAAEEGQGAGMELDAAN
jgi:hypothetical protein